MAVPASKSEIRECKSLESEHEPTTSITEEEHFDEVSVLCHLERLLEAENYEQLSRDLGRLRWRFPEEMEPVIAQVQDQFYQKEGSSLYIP